MKAAAVAVAVAVASLAAPALALASARPGEGFRILRRADGMDCDEARKTTETNCKAGSGIASQENPEYPAWITLQKLCSSESDRDGMGNAVCKKNVEECLEESKKFNDIKDCVAKKQENLEYPPWIILQKLCSSESDRDGMGNAVCKKNVEECLEESKKFNDIKDCVAKKQENLEYPPWIILQKLCSSESDRDGMGNAVCKKNVEECLEESKKFNDVKDCVAKRNSTVD